MEILLSYFVFSLDYTCTQLKKCYSGYAGTVCVTQVECVAYSYCSFTQALYTSGELPPMTIISPVGSVTVQVPCTPRGISPAGSHDWVRGK